MKTTKLENHGILTFQTFECPHCQEEFSIELDLGIEPLEKDDTITCNNCNQKFTFDDIEIILHLDYLY